MNKEEKKTEEGSENPFPESGKGQKAAAMKNPWKIAAIAALFVIAALAGALAWMVLTPRTITPEPLVVAPETATTTGEAFGDIPRQALRINWIPLDEQVTTTSSELALFGEFLKERMDSGPEAVIRLGTVQSGAYDGWTLVIHRLEEYGLGSYYSFFYVIHPPSGDTEEPLFFERYGYYGGDGPGFDRTSELTFSPDSFWIDVVKNNDKGALVIPELEDYPKNIQDSDGHGYTLSANGMRVKNPVEVVRSYQSDAVRTNFGPLISTKDLNNNGDPNSFALLHAADGVPVYYDLDIPFWYPSERGYVPGDISPQNITIRWDGDESYTTKEYQKAKSGGCGFESRTNVVDPKDLGELQANGILRNGGEEIPVFTPKDYSLDHFKPLFETWKYTHATGTLTDFVPIRPLFYYQDSWDRWVEFQSTEILPQGECGKPVIYLYPERATDFTVTLDPKGGFSYTEPTYVNGWRVHAEPDGALTNLDDGKTYPYLFWEGRGGAYSSPANYWVVAREDVERFLTDTLHDLGLNAKETADFKEFWLPRMQSALWYKVGFHGTRVMDALVPMSISETPDTVLRILMDYEELDREIPANPPRIPAAPSRKGFTVIEWGGVLRR